MVTRLSLEQGNTFLFFSVAAFRRLSTYCFYYCCPTRLFTAQQEKIQLNTVEEQTVFDCFAKFSPLFF